MIIGDTPAMAFLEYLRSRYLEDWAESITEIELKRINRDHWAYYYVYTDTFNDAWYRKCDIRRKRTGLGYRWVID